MKKRNNYRQGKQRTACWHGFSFSIRLRTPYTQAPWERHWWRTLTNTWNWRGACVLGQQLTLKSTHWTQGPLPAIRTSGNTGPRTRILLPSCSLHSEAEVLTSPACSIYFTLSCVTLLKWHCSRYKRLKTSIYVTEKQDGKETWIRSYQRLGKQ